MKPMAEDVILKLDGMYKSLGAKKTEHKVSIEIHKRNVIKLKKKNIYKNNKIIKIVKI